MKKNNLYAVILAGGSGTRFWPLSRRSQPKQFLKILGEKTLFKETLGRIKSRIPGKNIFIVTNAEYKKQVAQGIKDFGIPGINLLFEPKGKNTAPAICWAAFRIYSQNPNAAMVVLPSDHLIQNSNLFQKALQKAFTTAEKGFLVTLGIAPDRPETGYGYIKAKTRGSSLSAVSVERFVEKPSLEKAKKFLKNKAYFWNSGMFVWRADVILNEFRKSLPRIFYFLKNHHDPRRITRVWPKLESISVDYGILEKAKKVALIPCLKLGWSDVGSWQALFEVLQKNRNANIHRGRVIGIDNHDTLILGQERLIAAIGLKDTVVIDTPDALLICQKNQSQKVRDITALLKNQKYQKHL